MTSVMELPWAIFTGGRTPALGCTVTVPCDMSTPRVLSETAKKVERGRGRPKRWLLEGAVAQQDRSGRLRQDLNVKPQRPAARILQVQANHIVKPHSAASAHLPQTGDAWFDFQHTSPVPYVIFFVFVLQRRTRAHERHI